MLLFGLTLALLGVLAAPSLLLDKKPEAKELLAKIEPYQGWIGVFACVWGIFGVFQVVFNLGMLASSPISWAIWAASVVLLAALGFLLGYNLIQQYALSKNEAARAKGEEVLSKLRPLQGKLGLVGICVGTLAVVMAIIF